MKVESREDGLGKLNSSDNDREIAIDESSSAVRPPSKKYVPPPPPPITKYLPVKKVSVVNNRGETKTRETRHKIFGHFDDGMSLTSPKILPPSYDEIDFTPRAREAKGNDDDYDGESEIVGDYTRESTAHAITRGSSNSNLNEDIIARDHQQSIVNGGSRSALSEISVVSERLAVIRRAQHALESKLGDDYYNQAR